MKNHWQTMASILFPILLAGLAAGTSFGAEPLDTWERVGQIQTNVVSLQLLNGQLAAVGAGQVHVSSNGVTWRSIRAPNNPVQAVGFGAGTYLAVGSNVVSVSADLTNWTSRLLGGAVNLRTVAFGKDVFVAKGDGQAWCTANGSDWFRATGTLGARQNATLFDGVEFLSVGVDFTVLTSVDGQVWRQVVHGQPTHFAALASDGSNTTATLPWRSQPRISRMLTASGSERGATARRDGPESTIILSVPSVPSGAPGKDWLIVRTQ